MKSANPTTDDVTTGLELSEAVAWSDLFRLASPAAKEVCGLDVRRVDSAEAVVASELDVLAFNRVIGFGVDRPASEGTIDDIVEFYGKAKARRFFVQLSPASSLPNAARWLEARGFRRYNHWVKLYRPVGDVPPFRSDLRVERIGTEHAGEFGAIVASCLGWPAFVGPWVACLVGQPHWRHYVAFDGRKPVATAAMRVVGDDGWIDFAATLPDYRGRGAQGALLSRRLEDAAEIGLKRVVVETAESTPERPSSSFRNTIRCGFRVAYVRPNFLFEA